MTGCPTRQVHDRAGNVFWLAQSPVGILFCHLCLTAVQRHQSRGHLRGKEARRNTVAKDVPRAEVDSQVAGKVNRSRFGGIRILTTDESCLGDAIIPLDAE